MSVERLIIQPTLKDNWLSVKDFVAQRQSGEPLASDIVTPLSLASRMQADAEKALNLVDDIETSDDVSFMYEVADIKIWANLGLYYAEKLRGAVALHTYRVTGEIENKLAAINHLKQALNYWDQVIAISRPIYNDMPLAHYNRPNNQRVEDNHFHWALLRDAIAADVDVAINFEFSQ